MLKRRTFIKLTIAGLLGGGGVFSLLRAYKKNTLPIITYPDPGLRHVSAPINMIDEPILSLAKSMISTLRYKAPLEFFSKASLYKGLSAPQVGVPKRLIICGLYGEIKAMVNPEIVEKKGHFASNEYCLSLPNHDRRIVNRPRVVIVSYKGLDQADHTLTARESSAALLAHEIDHLNGVLYIDY